MTSYTSESLFLQSNTIESISNFDSFATNECLGYGAFTLDGVVYAADSSPPGTPQWRVTVNWAHSPPHGVYTNVIRDRTLSFGEGNYVEAFGFWLGAGSSNLEDLFAEETNGQVTAFQLKGPGRSFRGFRSTVGIKSVAVNDWPGDGSKTNWVMDDV